MSSVAQAQVPSRMDIARIIYTAIYSGHDVPAWDDAPAWRKHRAIVAAGNVMAKLGITPPSPSVTVVQQRPASLRERIAERRAG